MNLFLKQTITGIVSVLSLSSVHASGIPTADAANLQQNLTSYVQQLKDYSQYLTEYAKQLQQYERQIKDATRQYTDVFTDVYSGYKEVMKIADGVTNMRNNFKSTMDYIKNNYGDSEFWKQCALTACDPTNQVVKGFESMLSNFEYSMGATQSATEATQSALNRVQSLEQKISSGGDEGISQNLQTIAQLQAQAAQINAELNMAMNQFMQAQSAQQIAEARENQAIIKKASMMFDASALEQTQHTFFE